MKKIPNTENYVNNRNDQLYDSEKNWDQGRMVEKYLIPNTT